MGFVLLDGGSDRCPVLGLFLETPPPYHFGFSSQDKVVRQTIGQTLSAALKGLCELGWKVCPGGPELGRRDEL